MKQACFSTLSPQHRREQQANSTAGLGSSLKRPGPLQTASDSHLSCPPSGPWELYERPKLVSSARECASTDGPQPHPPTVAMESLGRCQCMEGPSDRGSGSGLAQVTSAEA